MKGAGSVVLLHGFTGAPAAWDRVIEHLPAGTKVSCPWLGGHGAAEHHGSTFDDEVNRLAGEVESSVGGGAHLCGYSLGGRLALGLAIRHPGLFRSVTLIGAHPGLETDTERAARIEQDERWGAMLERDGIAVFLEAWEALPLFASQRGLPEGRREAQNAWRRASDPRGLVWAIRTLGLGHMPSWRPHLASVEVPVRLVVGESDDKFKSLAVWMTDRLPRGSLRVIAGSGHNVVLERPTAIGALLLEDSQ